MSLLFPDDDASKPLLEVNGLSVDPEVIFTNKKNVHKKRIEKRQRKLLGQVEFLKPFLEADERILLCTTGCSPMSILEQFLTGHIVFYLKRSIFVFTDRRIFHIPTTTDYKYRNSVAQIPYSSCKQVGARSHVLTVKYNSGKKEQFHYIHTKERSKLRVLAKSFTLGNEQGERRFLCPSCTKMLTPDVYECADCGQGFKSKKEAQKISWMYPGGGYFYTGHYALGILDAMTEVFLVVGIINTVVDIARGKPGLESLLLTMVLVLIVEKFMTVYHSKGFIEEYIVKGSVKLVGEGGNPR